MDRFISSYTLSDDTIFFSDTIEKNQPFIALSPRDHESLFFVTDGALLYENSGKSEIIKKGQVGYIKRSSKDKSSAYNCEKVSYVAINFSFERNNRTPPATLPFKTLCSENINNEYEKLFTSGLNHYLSKLPGHITVVNGILLQIIGYIYNEHVLENTNQKKMRQIEKSIEYLKNNYIDSTLTIKDLAKSIYMSEKNFRRIFSEIYKKTPYKFLQEFRISKAEILLLNTAKNISSIASECGFSDVYSFSHCFKNHIGVSPIEYRNSHI